MSPAPRPRGRPPFPRWLAVALCLSAALTAGCTEDSLTGVNPKTSPGASPQTVLIRLRASEMGTWRDTSYVGYAVPSASNVLILSDRTSLRSRLLARFGTLPDSTTLDTVTYPVESFSSVRFRLVVDTASSSLPSAARVQVLGLAHPFDAAEATWQSAAAGQPWDSAGGDFADSLGSVDVTALADTLFAPVDVDGDSLLKAWRSSGGEPGIGIVVSGSGVELRIRQLAVEAEGKLGNTDTTVAIFRSPSVSTFIYDPPAPPAGSALRLAGLPSYRAYFVFAPPDSAEGVPLRGGTIDRAELIFHPLAAPADPFGLEGPLTTDVFSLLANPFDAGPRTPIGSPVADSAATLDPDSLAAGDEVRFNITPSVRAWASAPGDSLPELWMTLRPYPLDGQSFGFWDFGSLESPADLQPELELVVTPPADFRLP